MTGTLFPFEEIRPARIEHCRNARSRNENNKKRNARKKSVLQEYFETVFIGTLQRRKDETQFCCVCGEITVLHVSWPVMQLPTISGKVR
jgi:hypothetical protein